MSLESIISAAFAVLAVVGWFCWANELWPFNTKSKVYVDRSGWGRARQAALLLIQFGCVAIAVYANSLSPDPVQPLAPVIVGWAVGLVITFVIVKAEDLVRWLLRKNDVLPPAVEHRDTVSIPHDSTRRRIGRP